MFRSSSGGLLPRRRSCGVGGALVAEVSPKIDPCHWFAPLLALTITTWLPIVCPYSALNEFVTTLYSRMPSRPSVVPAAEIAAPPMSEFIGAPSIVKLFDRIGAPLAVNQTPDMPPTEFLFWETPACIRLRSM